MRFFTLFFLMVGSHLSCVMATFQPASGFYVCPEPGMICNVINSQPKEDGDNNSVISVISNGFSKTRINNIDVFTSTRAKADLSITGGMRSMIDCHQACECQSITRNDGCSIPPPSDEKNAAADPFREGMLVNELGEMISSRSGNDNRSAGTTVMVFQASSWLLGAAVLSLILM